MKKILMSTLTAGLAFAMIANTDMVNANTSSSAETTFDAPDNPFRIDSESAMNFGENTITDEDTQYVSSDPLSLNVTDLRGTWEGWSISSKLSQFTDTEKEGNLYVSDIKLGTPNIQSTAGENYLPTVVESLLIPGADAKTMVTAESDKGMGTSTIEWAGENITLNIPNSLATVGNYTATIDWTIESTSTSGE